jgi:Pyruvate/2-oxoacid:ferredoxin oxidoreductase delta subunit
VKQTDLRVMFKKASKSDCTSNVVVCPDPSIDFFNFEDAEPE